MKIKQVMALLLAFTLLGTNLTVYAEPKDKTEVASVLEKIPNITEQLNSLYIEVANELDMNPLFVKVLHILAGGQAIYTDKKPNIYKEKTLESMQAPMEIYGANTEYKKAEFIECPDSSIERPSKYYMPDAVYSVAYDIKKIMDERYKADRGQFKEYFDSLQDESKHEICFYEAIMKYTGETEENIGNFYKAYEKLMYSKSQNENVVEELADGKIRIKNKFVEVFNKLGIRNKNTINNISIILSFDGNLAENDSIENIRDEFILPYVPNYTSRENMLVAASCLVGKVRYVWGGGHSGLSHIDGINPVWKYFEALYPKEPSDDETIEGFGTCIKPSGSWCPTHGEVSGAFHGETIHSLDEYIELSADTLNTDEILSPKYREMLNKIDYSDGINVHTLDGLDCSGFASWLYNQITDDYELNSEAVNFTHQAGIKEIKFGDELLPGDVFAWTTHIVVVVGKLKEGSKAYVTIEQTPNVLKYGVMYYTGATSDDIEEAKKIAREANQLIGGLNEYEEPKTYCMNNMGKYQDIDEIITYEDVYDKVNVWYPYEKEDGYDPNSLAPTHYEYTEQTEYDDGVTVTYYTKTGVKEVITEVTVDKQEYALGRFEGKFLDDDNMVNEKGILRDLSAVDIIQHTLTKLPISYVSGYYSYNGVIFDKTKVGTNLGIAIEENKDDNKE